MNDERKLTNAAAKGSSGHDDDRFLPIPAYSRVSMGDKDQTLSVEMQTNHYRDLIRNNHIYSYEDDGNGEIGGNTYE